MMKRRQSRNLKRGDHCGDEGRWEDNIQMDVPVEEWRHEDVDCSRLVLLMNTAISLLVSETARKFSSI